MENNRAQELDAHWRILRDTVILSGAASLLSLVKPLRAVVLGRVLGPYDYGLLNIPLPYVQILSIFANMGISAAVLRLASVKLGRGDEAGARSVSSMGIGIALAAGTLWALLLALAAPYLAVRFASEPSASALIVTAAWMVPGITLLAVLSNVYLAFDRGALLGVVRSMYSFLGLVLPVAAVLIFRRSFHVIASFALVELSGAAIAYALFRRRIAPGRAAAGPGESPRALITLAHTFFYTNLGWMVMNSVDRIMIQRYCATEILGFYAVAVFFVNFLNILPMNFAQVITSALTKNLSRRETEPAWDALRKTTTAVSFLLAPMVVFSSAFSRDLIVLLFSPAFEPAGILLALLAYAAMLNFVCKLTWSIIVSDSNPGARSVVYLIGGVLNILLNLLFIPRYGAVGAALASIASYVFLALTLQILLKRSTGRILPLGRIVPFFLFAAVAYPVEIALSGAPLYLRLAAGLPASLLAYAALCLFLGLVGKPELKSFSARAADLPAPFARAAVLIVSILEKAAKDRPRG